MRAGNFAPCRAGGFEGNHFSRFIHAREVAFVRKHHGDARHLVQGAARLFENRLDVDQALRSLFLDGCAFDCARGGIDQGGPGDEDQACCLNCLAVRGRRFGCLGSKHDLTGHGDWFCRNSAIGLANRVVCRRSRGQRVELVCCGRNSGFGPVELAFLDHVHRLDASQDGTCAVERLKPSIGRTMLLIAR